MSSSHHHLSLLQALSLDLTVLEYLLKNHRNSHGRTIYFRRMSMVYQAIQRWQPIQRFKEEEEKDFASKKKSKNMDQWSLKDMQSNNKKKKKEEQQQTATTRTFRAQEMVCSGLIEIISRIQHASNALFTEVARGFFLPFCTVGLGALARISWILQRLGQMALSKWLSLSSSSSITTNDDGMPRERLEKTMEILLQRTTTEKEDGPNEEATLISLANRMGIHLPNSQPKSSSSSTTTTTATAMMKRKNQAQSKSEERRIHNDTKILSPSTTLEHQKKEEDSDDDIGESVTSPMVASTTTMASTTTTTTTTTTSNNRKQRRLKEDASAVDQNSAMVESFKDDAKRKKSKKRKELPSSSTTAGGAPTVVASKSSSEQKRKQKKKKKSKKGDFFDSLFD